MIYSIKVTLFQAFYFYKYYIIKKCLLVYKCIRKNVRNFFKKKYFNEAWRFYLSEKGGLCPSKKKKKEEEYIEDLLIYIVVYIYRLHMYIVYIYKINIHLYSLYI